MNRTSNVPSISRITSPNDPEVEKSEGAKSVSFRSARICSNFVARYAAGVYPAWVKAQMADCRCEHARSSSPATGGRYISRCADGQGRDAHDADTLTYCGAKQWLLDHMPEFDKGFMPPSVAVDGASMFDDNIVFALMAYNASSFMRKLPLALVHSYVLPYADFHEARVNWRPLLFAKFFGAAHHTWVAK